MLKRIMALMFMIGFMLAPAAALAATAAGAISGTVTDGTRPLQDISVWATYPGNPGTVGQSVRTDANGKYTIINLNTGTYNVYFFGRTYGYIDEWYDNYSPNTNTATQPVTTVTVTAPNTTANINAVLSLSGAIAGTVTDGTNPLPQIYVEAQDAATNTYVWGGWTDASGKYTIKDFVPTGNYKVLFNNTVSGGLGHDPNYSSFWYNNQSDINAAALVTVTAPNTTANINGVLSKLMALPVTASSFSYQPTEYASKSDNAASAKPIGVGKIASGGNTLGLNIALDAFPAPVDIYFGVVLPLDPNNVYLLKPDNSFQLLSAGLAAWKSNNTGPVNESLFGELPVSLLPKGTYTLYLLVTPAGSTNSFYLWQTNFIVN